MRRVTTRSKNRPRSSNQKESLKLQVHKLNEANKKCESIHKDIRRLDQELTNLRVLKNKFEQDSVDSNSLSLRRTKLLHNSVIEPPFAYPDYPRIYESLHLEMEDFLTEFNIFTANHDKLYRELVGSIANVVNKKFPSVQV